MVIVFARLNFSFDFLKQQDILSLSEVRVLSTLAVA